MRLEPFDLFLWVVSDKIQVHSFISRPEGGDLNVHVRKTIRSKAVKAQEGQRKDTETPMQEAHAHTEGHSAVVYDAAGRHAGVGNKGPQHKEEEKRIVQKSRPVSLRKKNKYATKKKLHRNITSGRMRHIASGMFKTKRIARIRLKVFLHLGHLRP